MKKRNNVMLSAMLDEFGDELSFAEQKLLECVERGESADFRTGDKICDDVTSGDSWGKDRVIRAEFVVWLCSSGSDGLHVKKGGIKILGARIEGNLDLEFCNIDFPLWFYECYIMEPVILRDAKVSTLVLSGSHLGGVHGDRLRVYGMLVMRNVISRGTVWLMTTHIEKGVDLSGSSLTGIDDIALNLGRMVTGDAIFCQDAEIYGQVILDGASVKGDVDFSGTRISNSGSVAFTGEGLDASLAIKLVRMQIQGSVLLQGIRTDGGLYFIGSGVAGYINTERASVGGNLNFTGVFVHGYSGFSVRADLIDVSCIIAVGAVFAGRFSLVCARIRSHLDMRGVSLDNYNGDALVADGVISGGGILMRGIEADEASDRSLSKEIQKNGCPVTVNGKVRLVGAHVRFIDLSRSLLKNQDGVVVDLENTEVTDNLILTRQVKSPVGDIILRGCKIGMISDDETSWPAEGYVYIDGLQYRGFWHGNEESVQKRIQWIKLQPEQPFFPQPYEQLARYYRSIGRESGEIEVLVEKQKARIKFGNLGWSSRWWGRFLGLTTGYGYKPHKVFMVAIVPVIFIGYLVFSYAGSVDAMIPVNSTGPDFYPFVYSVDAFFPFLDLDQEVGYIPDKAHPASFWINTYLWLHIIFGWIFSTLAAAALAGLIKK